MKDSGSGIGMPGPDDDQMDVDSIFSQDPAAEAAPEQLRDDQGRFAKAEEDRETGDSPVAEAGSTGQPDLVPEATAEEPETPVPDSEDDEPPPTPEAPETPEATESPEPPEATETDETPDTKETEEPVLYAGRFDSIEKMEAYVKETQAAYTRETQKRAGLERELQEIQSALQAAAPQLQQWAAQQTQAEDPELELDNPQAFHQAVQQRAQQEAQRLMAEQEDRTRQAQAQTSIQEFRSLHPDAVNYEADVKRVFEQAREESEDGYEVLTENLVACYEVAKDPRLGAILDGLDLLPTGESVALAQELADSPALREVVNVHPHVIQSDQGMKWARGQANLPARVKETQDETRKQRAEQKKKAAFVEKGNAGVPVQAAPTGELSWLDEMRPHIQSDDKASIWDQ